MNITYSDFTALYGKEIAEKDFSRLCFAASLRINDATTTADGFCKARDAAPTNEYGAEALKRCICELIHTMAAIDSAKQDAENASGYILREDGTVLPRRVSSISSGTESISYGADTNQRKSPAQIAALDSGAENKMLTDIIERYLRGVSDSNGVNMLYRGVYPIV